MSRVSNWALPAALFAAALLVGESAFAADDIEQKAQICAACHGANGVPINNTTPVIWGQDEGYLYLQLRDFKRGARKNAMMEPIASQLEKADMYALAAYFKKKAWPNLGQPSAPDDVAAKAESAAKSIGCRGCHLDHFQGDGSTARLAGQWQPYLLNTMMGFRDGSRGNNPGMSDLMKATPADDLEALSQYLAGLQIDAYLGHGR
ncbi:MAG TPA: c-type cytochrome [Methyloceanibacter sp.]|nr:c-type cytochrome [Methyloceanibacter sp.]